MKQLIILFVLLASTSSFAQLGFGKPEDINKVKEVPLLVVLRSQSEKMVKRLTKKADGQLEEYLQDIETYNGHIKAAVDKNWTFSETIQYITEDELEDYDSKKNKGKYAFFQMLIDRGDDHMSLLKNKGLITTYAYAISLAGKKKPVYAYMYATKSPNEADFKFIIQQMQHYFAGRLEMKGNNLSRKEMMAQFNERAAEIPNKTLWLDADDLHEKLQPNFGSLYPYPHKLVPKEEIDALILEGSSEAAYLKIVPVGQLTGSNGPIKSSKLIHVQYIMDAEDGEIMAFVAPGGLGLGGAIGNALRDGKSRLKEKDLNKILETIQEN